MKMDTHMYFAMCLDRKATLSSTVNSTAAPEKTKGYNAITHNCSLQCNYKPTNKWYGKNQLSNVIFMLQNS